MPNITEKDIIAHLKDKVKFHQQEAQRMENLLSAFTPVTHPTAKVQQASQEAMDEQPVKGKAGKAKPAKAKVTASKAKKVLTVPGEYQPTLTINGKIAYALSQITSGYGEDIAAKIVELQPGLEVAKVMKQISGVLSTLKANGQLSAVKEGRKDKFSLVG